MKFFKAIGGGGVFRPAEAVGKIIARPTRVSTADGSKTVTATLAWSSLGPEMVEVRVDAPNGPLLSRGGPSGSTTTGHWVRDGMRFYLQDVSGGLPLTSTNTVDAVEIKLNYDSPHSRADLFSCHLYALLFSERPADLRMRIIRQYLGVAVLFHLRRVMRKLKLGKIPIRMVFLVEEPLNWWSIESLYRACRSDPRFETHVVNVGFEWLGVHSDCSAFFHRNGIQHLDGVKSPVRLDHLYPDLIVTSSPYDELRPYPYRTEILLRYAELVYIPYGIDFSDGADCLSRQTYGLDVQRNAWRIFSRSKQTVGAYKKYGGVPSRRVVGLGLPVIDRYYSSAVSDALPQAVISASEGKFKVLYAPHHSLEGWSTFLRYGEHVRRLIEENEDCFLVFRPHPGLVGKLKQANLMSEEAFRSFFAGARCCLCEAEDYYGLFHWSDVLISDASSFLVEHAPTGKPIIYLHREDGWWLDKTMQKDVSQRCYVARSADEITATCMQLKQGVDPLKRVREVYRDDLCVGKFSDGAGKRIADYLGKLLA